MIAGCIKEHCWRKNLILTSERLNNESSEALDEEFILMNERPLCAVSSPVVIRYP